LKSLIKLAIVDDDELYKQVLKSYIKQCDDINITIDAANGKELINLLPKKKPELILLDLEMPVMNGIETLEYLAKQYPDIKVLIFTIHNDDGLFNYLIEKGANSFLPKDIGIPKIIEAIYAVNKVGYYFANIDLKKIIVAKKNINLNLLPSKISFSKRQIEIIQLICQQYTNKEISQKLFISQRTVDGHRTNLLQKAGVKNTVGLILFAIKNNLIDESNFIEVRK
jgi:DNA-binding NarL/FixJ family response regulator